MSETEVSKEKEVNEEEFLKGLKQHLIKDGVTQEFFIEGTRSRTGKTLRPRLGMLRMVLEAEGYKTQTYNDGASALDGFAESPPDLAILDIKMPRMDGMELLRRIRQKSDLPVIFLTSKDDETDEEAGLEMGADDYVVKPFSARELLARVVGALAGVVGVQVLAERVGLAHHLARAAVVLDGAAQAQRQAQH